MFKIEVKKQGEVGGCAECTSTFQSLMERDVDDVYVVTIGTQQGHFSTRLCKKHYNALEEDIMSQLPAC